MNIDKKEQLNQIVISGYKSIKDCDLELGNINVLIGSNGAGKSNFLSVFPLLQNILVQNLARYASKKGVNSLFYNSTKITDTISIKFHFEGFTYAFDLELSEGNNLVFSEESLVLDGKEYIGESNHNESKWEKAGFDKDDLQTLSRGLWHTYHFNDTSATSRIKREHNVSHCEILMWDGSNLAAFLYRLQQHYTSEYKSIVRAIQMVAPYFKDFHLKPEEANQELIILRWQEKDRDGILNASQLSDGTLRFACLATLLLQPSALQPSIVIVDEPELGLHPFAMTILAEMVQKAAVSRQIIIATQSVELLDNFDVSNVVVVDRDKNGSDFKRLNPEQLSYWLGKDYTLGELWNKNVFGGRFAR